MNRYKITANILLAIFIMANISSAAMVEVTTGKLPAQLHEGDQVDFTIKIKLDSDEEKNIIIETNLVSSNNKPIYDFGDLNPSITDNRYNQKIALNTSSIAPIIGIIQVSISGKVPEGEVRIKPGNSDLIISKFAETKLKFYEVRTGQKLAGIESFELIVKKKENFENTLGSIRRTELDGIKREVRKLFDLGLATEAQNIANEMINIKWPDNLMLFGIIKINDSLMLNGIFIVFLVVVFVIGYVLGSKQYDEHTDEG